MINLQRIRKAQGLTQEQVSVLADMNHTTISKYENGASSPRTPAATHLANVLGVSVAELMYGPGDPDNGVTVPLAA